MRTNQTQEEKNLVGFSRVEKLHPYKTFLFFALLGSTIIFLALAFLYSLKIVEISGIENFQMPRAFIVSTILLLLSSMSISKVVDNYNSDSFSAIKNTLGVTLFLAVLFTISQVIGWKVMFDAGYFINGQTGISFIYLISGLHLMHVICGIGFIIYLLTGVQKNSNDIVKSLLFFTDNYQKTKLELATIYWHFVDILWLGLFLMFLFTF
ncbi:MAG: cytochrome C oxidase subunit III [Bacteroidia bacterium]|nr:cytochrome C oxidase subunit III [Bacteroidia bacterium]NNM15118.1 cytochrome C oxidase subunit III [Bacteroidia bacterium]